MAAIQVFLEKGANDLKKFNVATTCRFSVKECGNLVCNKYDEWFVEKKMEDGERSGKKRLKYKFATSSGRVSEL